MELTEIDAHLQWTVKDIDAQIKALQAKKRALKPAKIKKEKVNRPTRHTRSLVCSNCGISAHRAELEQVSRYEYQHIVCPRPQRIIKVDFQI